MSVQQPSPTRPESPAAHDERGYSLSALVLVVTVALFLVTGLVVDGGQQVAATRTATSVADQAARAATEAGAPARLEGSPQVAPALQAARAVIEAHPQVEGTATIEPGPTVVVRTTVTRSTVFVSAVGIGEVTGQGRAEAVLTEPEH